jgi:site-specific DNA-cytosine methylase
VVTDEYRSVEDHALWCFMAGASELGYHGGFIHLDAQHIQTPGFPFAVPQRRDRLFFVGYLGDWTRAAAVLLDAESLRRNPPPRREAGQRPAPTISARPTGGGGLGTDFDCDGGLIAQEVAPTLNAHFGDKMGLENQHINQGGGLFVATRGDVPECPRGEAGRGIGNAPAHDWRRLRRQ